MSLAPSKLQVSVHKVLNDGQRHFELTVCFSTSAAITALYGPSGAGKSLTLQAIAGLLQPDTGHISLGHEIFFDSATKTNIPAAQRNIGYLFQHYALFPHLTVRQNIEFGLTSWTRRKLNLAQRAHIDNLIDSFGLGNIANSRPLTLSGGQQQRTALARALARQPRLLLLDEPFAALNPLLRHALRQELASHCQRWAVPTVMITHDVDDVLALANHVCLVDQGRVSRQLDVASYTPQDLRTLLTGIPAAPVSATPSVRPAKAGENHQEFQHP